MNELQSLVHECMVKSGQVECAAIVKKSDGSVRATSVGYEVTSEQSSAIFAAFANPNDAMKKGVKFNGAFYKCIRADKDAIYAKKVQVHSFTRTRTHTHTHTHTHTLVMQSDLTCPHASVLDEVVDKTRELYK